MERNRRATSRRWAGRGRRQRQTAAAKRRERRARPIIGRRRRSEECGAMTPTSPGECSFWTIPGRKHYLNGDSSDEEKNKFGALFDSVWLHRIPLTAREATLRGWRECHRFSSSVYLQSGGNYGGQNSRPAYYQCLNLGFYFCADDMLSFPNEEWARLVIAHEIAHAYH